MLAVSLAALVALLVAVVFTAGVAEAKGGGGGRGGGGGGGGKPSGISSKPSSDSASPGSAATKNTSAKSGASSGIYNPKFAPRHGSLSNFFLWAWIFHSFDDDDYEEEYGESNAGFGGWAIIGAGAIGAWFLFRYLRKRATG